MPGKDTTGPQSKGPGTGRGSGGCINRQSRQNKGLSEHAGQNTGKGRHRRIRGNGRQFNPDKENN
ncbi:MAG: DUF5320 family protein [Pseudomonadota bacterium]